MAVSGFNKQVTSGGVSDRVYGVVGTSNFTSDTFSPGHYAFYLHPSAGTTFSSPTVVFSDSSDSEIISVTLVDSDLDGTATSPWVGYVYLTEEAAKLSFNQGTSVAGNLRVSYSNAPVMSAVIKYTSSTSGVVMNSPFRAIVFGGGGSGGRAQGYYGWNGGGGGSGYMTDVSDIPAGTYNITVGGAGGTSSVGNYNAAPGNGGGAPTNSTSSGGSGGSGGGAPSNNSSVWIGGINGNDGAWGGSNVGLPGTGSGVPTPDTGIYGASPQAGAASVGTAGVFLAGGSSGRSGYNRTGDSAPANSASGGGGGASTDTSNEYGGSGGSGVVYLVV